MAQAALQPPLGSPAFPGALASQLTLWVRKGVQQAQLHLSPEALGPVQVAISLDGHRAQVHLSAAQGSTRQVLEQALPTLAGHLAEAGFALAGGGVFSSGTGSGSGGGQPSPFGVAPADGVANGGAAGTERPLAPGVPLLRSRGLVDLLA
jgi:flagellar hook-length control protein FliK